MTGDSSTPASVHATATRICSVLYWSQG